jgi:hypothetical protein
MREAGARQHQPGGREHDDHSQEPPVTDHPGGVLKRPEDPHTRVTLGDVPRKMEYQPDRCPGQHGPVPAISRRDGGERGHGGQRMRDGTLALVPQQAEIQRYVIDIDGDRCDERRNIEAARRVDEERQDEQPQGCGAQMGDLIDGAGGPHAEGNRAVGSVECQRDRGQQQRTGPPPDRPRDG